MGVNADWGFDRLLHYGNDFRHFVREGPSVCIAKHDPVRTGLLGFLNRLQCIVRVVLVAVKEMLSVINNLKAFALQVFDGVVYHGKILFQGRLDCLMYMEIPRLAEDGGNGNADLENPVQIHIVFGECVLAASLCRKP